MMEEGVDVEAFYVVILFTNLRVPVNRAEEFTKTHKFAAKITYL